MFAEIYSSELDGCAPHIRDISLRPAESLSEAENYSLLYDGTRYKKFDFLSNWNGTEVLGPNQGKLDWLDPYPDGSVNGDELSSHIDSSVIGPSRLKFKLNAYLYGTHEFNVNSSSSSWDVPETHPLKISLIPNGSDSSYTFNSNWHERLQFSFRSIWQHDLKGHLHRFYNEEEYSLLREVGRFTHACKLGATRLLHSLLSSSMLVLPYGFVEINPSDHPDVYKMYKPKFNRDRIFLNDGILFTLVLGNYDDHSRTTYTSVKKIYSNDSNGKQAICDALYNLGKNTKFVLPVQCTIDYLGIRVVAEPFVHIRSSHSFVMDDILQGSTTAQTLGKHKMITASLLEDKELYHDLRAISEYLGLVSWPLPFGSSDIEGIIHEDSDGMLVKCDNMIVIRNTHEVLPPSVNLESPVDPLFKSRFRLEFCTKYYKHPLKCSLKSQPLFKYNDDLDDNDMFIKANDCNSLLLDKNIDKFHNLVDSWDISNAFHSSGINLRWIGVAYEKTLHGGLKDVLAVELVARSLKHLWDSQLEMFFQSESLDFDYLLQALLRMINDTLGLTSNSSSFWHQRILPEISMHYNVINLDGINCKSIPQILLRKAIEFNLGIILPSPENGIKYDGEIELHDLKSVNPSMIMMFGVDESCSKTIIPRLHIAYPRSDLSIYKAASKLYNKQDNIDFQRFISDSDSFGMGICGHVRAKLLGYGYPCDPICVLNDNFVCNIYKHNKTGLDLLCLSEALLLVDPIKRSKLLMTLGYEFLRHKSYDEALQCCDFIMDNASDIAIIEVQAKLLKIECCSLTGDHSTCIQLYEDLLLCLKHIEGIEGVFKLQLLLIMSFDAWKDKDYHRCISYIVDTKESFTNLLCIPNYEWLPIALLSLLGYCYGEIGRISDATKIHREVVRHCNISQLPKFTLCKLMWILVDSLIRVGSYEQGHKLAIELYSIVEKEFGSLSLECLHSLYLCAWIHQQIGCIHLLHPYLYLSNSDNIISLQDDREWLDNVDLILDEFATASSCDIKRRHCNESISFYTLLCARIVALSRDNRDNILEMLKVVLPTLDLSPLQRLHNITSESIKEYETDENRMGLCESSFLKVYLENGDLYRQKLLLVIRNFISVKILSLTTEQCYVIACKLYSAYVSQVSSDYMWEISTGSDKSGGHRKEYKDGLDLNHRYRYGSKLVKASESFLSSITIRKNSVPHSGHDIRSIEMLLLKEPGNSEVTICELCLNHCQNDLDVENSLTVWFDSVFEFVSPQGVDNGGQFLLSLDILRHFLTPCQRLVILGLVAGITKSDLTTTITFQKFKSDMLEAKCRKWTSSG